MADLIEHRTYLLRGQEVMLDADLAELFEVDTRILIQAVRRKPERFPLDFMFQLNAEEADSLPISIAACRDRRRLPYAFTEPGVFMLSSVLKSERAVSMSKLIVRTFIQAAQEHAWRTHQQHASVLEDLVKDIERLKTDHPLARHSKRKKS